MRWCSTRSTSSCWASQVGQLCTAMYAAVRRIPGGQGKPARAVDWHAQTQTGSGRLTILPSPAHVALVCSTRRLASSLLRPFLQTSRLPWWQPSSWGAPPLGPRCSAVASWCAGMTWRPMQLRPGLWHECPLPIVVRLLLSGFPPSSLVAILPHWATAAGRFHRRLGRQPLPQPWPCGGGPSVSGTGRAAVRRHVQGKLLDLAGHAALQRSRM